MHVIIVGCGRVGSGLAAELAAKGHSVAVVDRKPEAFRRLPTDFSGTTVPGVGFDRERLKAAGIEHADAVAAVTSGDNSNILTARVAREAFGVERVVARIYDTRRAAIYERLGIPTIAAVQWTTDRVLRSPRSRSRRSGVDAHPRRASSCSNVPVPRQIAGQPLTDLEAGGLGRIAAVARGGQSVLPEPTMAAQEGDVVWVVVRADQVEDYDRTVGAESGGH